MKLYKVVDTKNKETVAEGFATKFEAKNIRNQLNGPIDLDKISVMPRYIVSKDVDHARFS